MVNDMRFSTVVIANGAALSTPLWLNGRAILAIRVPTAWTAAPLTFQAAQHDGTGPAAPWMDLFDATGLEVQAAAEASRHIAILPSALRGLFWLRLRSGTAAAPVNQTADRQVLLMHGEVA